MSETRFDDILAARWYTHELTGVFASDGHVDGDQIALCDHVFNGDLEVTDSGMYAREELPDSGDSGQLSRRRLMIYEVLRDELVQ